MVCVPTVRLEVVKLAVPAAFTGTAAPRGVVPSRKVTVPVRLATAVEPGGVTLTVAVKVTGCPESDGLPEVTTTVLVPALFTVCVAVPLLPV